MVAEPGAILTAALPTRRFLDPLGTLLVLLVAGLALRVLVAGLILPLSGFYTDITAFSGWAIRLADVGPAEFYAPGYFADYPPAYLYVLWPLGEVSRFLEPLLGASPIRGLVKVPGIAADLGVAWLIYIIAARFFGDRPPIRWLGSGARIGLIGAAVYLFNPGTVFNSAVWGQMDSVGLVVILAGLYALGRGWTEAAGLAAVVAVLIKFQFAWLIPIVAVVHSPTPSTVSIAASSNGDAKNALAAWERWCSLKRILAAGTPSRVWMRCLIQTLSPSQVIIAS